MPRDFYELAENAFFSTKGFSRHQRTHSGGPTETEMAEALAELKPFVRHLRKQYRPESRGSTVNPGYTEQTAFAYLLAYVPKYIHQSMEVLERARLNMVGRDEKRVGFFCCGPCPEAVALLEVFPGQGGRKQPDRFCLELFDSGHEGWKAARDALLDLAFFGGPRDPQVEETGWESTLSEPPGIHDFDITEGLSPAHRQVVRRLDVAMFQNFNNELESAPEAAAQTIEEIAELLPPGSKLILSDLTDAMQSHQRLLRPLSRYGQVGVPNHEYSHIPVGDGQRAWRNFESIKSPGPTNGGYTRRFLLDGSEHCIPSTNVFLNYLVFERAPVPSP
jgi:hypothetical protein